MNAGKERIIWGIQYLRGFAALGVVLCHYGSDLKPYPNLSRLFNLGQSGVHVFFLISGFIIVYSLIKAGYQPRQFFRFLLKRSIRIDPSYYVMVILTLVLFKVLAFIPSFKGETIPFIPAQFIAHLFYYVPFTHYTFYNHVFWTLCVEFQFYLLVGLLYFLSDNIIYRSGFLIVFSLSSFIHLDNSYYLVFTYAPIFALGISLVSLYTERKVVNGILPLIFLGLTAYQFGAAIFILLIISSMAILFIKFQSKILFLLGQISYSLYLTHGLSFIVFAGILKKMHFNLDRHQLWWLLAEVLFAIIAGYLFYMAIEQPSLKLSKQVFYKKETART